MKEISTKSRKHDHHTKKSVHDSKKTESKPHSKNILKETHCKNSVEEPSTKRIKGSHSKYSSHSKKSKYEERSELPHHTRRNHLKKAAKESSNTLSDNEDQSRSRKHHRSRINESYEELSRRKKRIESELHALDLEEAAARETERKKFRREITDHSRWKEDDLPKDEINVRIKQEHLSDEDQEKHSSSHSRQKITNIEQQNKRKHQVEKLPGSEKNWGKPPQSDAKKIEKEKPNFSVSGKLAEDTNTYNGVVIKYNEPAEARQPRRKWRLYPFKGDTNLPFIPIHRQSAYLFGRTRLIADIPIDHPSCSKQHAVLQFRLVSYKREDNSTGKRVRPYIIDLESSNGTFVNNKKVDPRCYVELMEKDVIKFGFSSREYVLLHEESKNNSDDDAVDFKE